MKKLSIFVFIVILLFAMQQAFAIVPSEQPEATIGNMTIVETPACCDSDADMCYIVSRAIVVDVSKKKPHLFKKDYIFKNRINHKNQAATNFYSVYFSAESFFVVYSGERAYLLTGGDERGSC